MARQAPGHLKNSGRAFWRKVLNEFSIENEHDFKRLALCCECLDHISIARKEIEKAGAFFQDRFGQPKPHPGYGLIKDNMVVFARILRELGLDLENPTTPRPPSLY